MSDSYCPPPRRAIDWVERSLGGAHVLHAARLNGGVTSDVDRLTVRTRTASFAVVLRRWRPDNAWATGLIRRESAGLALLARHDLPAPRLLASDATGKDAGAPSLLMTALPGEPLPAPADFVRRLAVTLARVHDVAGPDLDPSDPHGFVPDADRSWFGDPGLARTLTEAAVAASAEMSTLIHGDYQPLNVLWSGEEISGVLDWAYTGLGAPATDVGHCRLAIAVLYSADAAEEFLRCYESEAGRAIDPQLDIRALLAYNPDWRAYARCAVAGRAHVAEAGVASRVTDLLRAAATRLADVSLEAVALIPWARTLADDLASHASHSVRPQANALPSRLREAVAI